jgi:hypothetical protein
MTTQPSGQPIQSDLNMGQKQPSEGREGPTPIIWPWEDPDDQALVTEEVSDDQVEDNLADEDAPFPG